MSPVRASLVYATPSADTTAPAAISDLTLVATNAHDDALFSTNAMPGDNGFSGGLPEHFEFRRAAAPIVTEGDWTAAGLLPSADASGPQDCTGMVGEYFEFYLTSLYTGTHYYHVRFTDLAGNVGGISNGVQVTLS